jgi:hypothetical protein
MSNVQPPPESQASLDSMWRQVWQKTRSICQEEIAKRFGANYSGGKLDGGAIGGTVPPTALPVATTAAAGIAKVDNNMSGAPVVITTASRGAASGVAELDSGGSVPLAELGNLPLGSTSTFGVVKADGSTITASGGVLSASSGSGTVTNVTGTAPVAVATGTTTPVVSVPAFVASGASHAAGLVPDPGSSAGSTKFLREDATFAVPAGGGVGGALTLVGHVSSTAFLKTITVPSTYKQLQVIWSCTDPTTYAAFFLQVNGDTSAVYQSTGPGGGSGAQPRIGFAHYPASLKRCVGRIDLLNAGDSADLYGFCWCARDDVDGVGNEQGLWIYRGTSGAITSIQFGTSAATWAGTLDVYGMA